MSGLDTERLVSEYLGALGEEFLAGLAPDGTNVLHTPYAYVSGSPVEIAAWAEGGKLVLSDRGGLADALLLYGIDISEPGVARSFVAEALARHGASLDGCTVAVPANGGSAGYAVRALLQALMEAQVAGQGAFSRTEDTAEPQAYSVIREVLEDRRIRYREKARVSGRIGRGYVVDFQLALARPTVTRAIIVVASQPNALLFAERWNFRFRDIREARPRLERLVMVDTEAPWTDRSQAVLSEACEGIFRSACPSELEEYVSAG